MLDRVTITGADESVDPIELVILSKQFPFVEWGILASQKRSGKAPRYPCFDWCMDFRSAVRCHNLKASLHLCGRWVYEILVGEVDVVVLELLDPYQRVQLNFGGEGPEVKPAEFLDALEEICNHGQREIIFQADGMGGAGYFSLTRCTEIENLCSVLFDGSGGTGLLPLKWPTPIDADFHGYSGGLGPHNLGEQLPRILAAAGDRRIWIDCETGVRTNDKFDLFKVRQVLDIAKSFM